MLRVKYGPFDRLERAFLDHLREHPPFARTAVVAPSRRMAERLERLAAVEAGTALLGVEFHTFLSFALAILDDAGGPAPGSGGPMSPVIGDPFFHRRLMDMLLSQHGDLGGHFGGAARPKALAAALGASVRDLIDANVSFAEVSEHFGDELFGGGEAARRSHRLLQLQSSYQQWLDRHGVMIPSDLAVAAGRAAEGGAYLSGLREILYYGFYDLTGRQLEFFERVTAARDAVLFFPYVKDHPAYRFCEPLFNLKLHRDGPPVFLGDSETPLPALRVFSASGSRDEVWAASKEILRLVEEEGFAFDEIGVVARTLEPYRAAVSEVFRADAIPFEITAGEPIKNHPLAAAAWELLSIKRRDFPSSAVIDILGASYFKRKCPAMLISRLEAMGITAGWMVWEAKLAQEEPELLGLLSAWREALSVAGNHGWKQWAAHARRFLETYLALPEDCTEEERRVWEELIGLTESLGALEVLGEVGWDVFLDAWIDKWESSVLEPSRRLGVRVMDAMDARGESFRALFILGLAEGMFPRQVREDPILRDEERARLRHPGGYWIATKLGGHDEERLLFHLLVSSAREKLHCVYSRSDEDGKAQTPSFYLREFCRSRDFDLETAGERVPRQPVERLNIRPLELLSPKEIGIRFGAEGIDPSDYLDAVGLDGRGLRQCLERLPEFNSTGAAGAMDGIVGPPKKFLERLLKRGLSPSALDALSRCPFQFFASYVLEMERDDRELERGELAADLRGKIYHEILERFYRSLRESGYWAKSSGTPGSSWERAFTEVVESVFEANDWRAVGLYPVVWKTVRRAMERRLRDFVRWDMARIAETGLVPTLLEHPVRGALDLPRLPSSLEGLEFAGRADRVDVDASGGRYQVVDYKTRWRGDAIDKLILRGERHQWPVYAELARSELPKGTRRELLGSHAYILETEEPEEDGHIQEYPGPLWERDRRAVFEGMAASVSEIARGRFPIRPEDGVHGHCAWCDFKGMCRKSHARSRSRAEELLEKRFEDRG